MRQDRDDKPVQFRKTMSSGSVTSPVTLHPCIPPAFRYAPRFPAQLTGLGRVTRKPEGPRDGADKPAIGMQ